MSTRDWIDEDRLVALSARLAKLPAAGRALDDCEQVGTLFARAASIARTELGFERGVVLTVEGDYLTAAETDALEDEASDKLRRAALARSIELQPGTEEAYLVGRGRRPAKRSGQKSVLRETLGLRAALLAPVAPESRALALLVLDRAEPPPDDADRALVTAFTVILGAALERLVFKKRARELSRELKYLTSSAQALISEVLEAPVALPSLSRHAEAFPRVDIAHEATSDGARDLFTEREREILALLVRGRSNREIAEELVLSPETVKAYVTRILRKLRASNRVEAAWRYLRMTGAR